MEKKEIVLLLLSSAVIGAGVSALIGVINSWRERVARERELLLTIAVDLTKSYMSRLSQHTKLLRATPELAFLPTMHRILKDVFKTGRIAPSDLEILEGTTKLHI